MTGAGSRDAAGHPATITKIGAVICVDGKVLAVRKASDPLRTFILPGGKPYAGESALETLAREVIEELGVEMRDAVWFGRCESWSAIEPMPIEMTMFDVALTGTPVASSEIAEIAWLDRHCVAGPHRLGSVLAKFVVPRLIERNRL